MTEHRFYENLISQLKTCPCFSNLIYKALNTYLIDLAKQEKYEVACRIRDMVNFLKKIERDSQNE